MTLRGWPPTEPPHGTWIPGARLLLTAPDSRAQIGGCDSLLALYDVPRAVGGSVVVVRGSTPTLRRQSLARSGSPTPSLSDRRVKQRQSARKSRPTRNESLRRNVADLSTLLREKSTEGTRMPESA